MIAEIPPDHVPSGTGVHNATYNNGTSQDTSVVAAGQKRRREETSDADSHTGRDNVSKRAETRRSRRNIQRTTIGEAPSVECNLRNSTNSSSEVKANDGLDLPATQYGAEHRPDETSNLNSVPGLVPVCCRHSQGQKENAPAERSVSSPPQRSHRKGTCSASEFVGARAILALSKPRVFSKPEHNLEPRKGNNGVHSQTETSHASDHAEDVEAETTPTWEARELDPDDFAFLVRRATLYRFEESNTRNEAFTRPTSEE
ncbi:hypothetical protein ACEPAF_1728 [Sanghuangporus sanghuang]